MIPFGLLECVCVSFSSWMHGIHICFDGFVFFFPVLSHHHHHHRLDHYWNHHHHLDAASFSRGLAGTNTTDMELKTNHKHMDHTGRCYLPYLSEWKIQTHNLYDLCNYLGTLFGEDPPVFAKQKRPAAGPAPQNSATTVPSPHSSSSSTKSNATPPPPQHSMHHSYHGGGSTGYAPQQHFAHHQNPMAHSHQFSRHPQQHAQNSYSQQPDYQTMQRQVLEGTRRTVVQKVQSKLSQFRQEQQGKIQQTLKDQREQQARLSFQESESKRLDQQFNLADQNMEKLSTDIQKLQKFINEEQSRGDLSVEDIIEFTDALSQQDMELTAEDSALEDCLYNLERALQRDLINTEEFLRTVRKLARKQFETRALKEKVRKRKMES
mmetsp:Transcript_1610/g.5519  ORF Transcript_1610/g.5519 Transcript_1610/m.5519 type:complete len:378 (-) Transcript_1610:2290-3423(-)